MQMLGPTVMDSGRSPADERRASGVDVRRRIDHAEAVEQRARVDGRLGGGVQCEGETER